MKTITAALTVAAAALSLGACSPSDSGAGNGIDDVSANEAEFAPEDNLTAVDDFGGNASDNLLLDNAGLGNDGFANTGAVANGL